MPDNWVFKLQAAVNEGRTINDLDNIYLVEDGMCSAWRVTIENHKRVEASVRLVEHIPPQAEIISASHAHERAAADRIVFDLVVPADKAVEVTYKVRVRR